MNICFGESLRRLRKEKNLTQEQLAARLNVSFQTISKWERDESWPDLSMLPVLAGFFGVRTDDLLGVDKAENERKIVELLDYFYTNASLRIGQYEEHKAQLAAMLKDNPNDYRLWTLHFGMLTGLGQEDTAQRCRERLPEIMPVYEMILENCTNDALRIDAKECMLHFYNRIIWKEPESSAAERAQFDKIMGELPGLRDSREYMQTFTSAGKPDEEQRASCRSAILEALNMLSDMISHLVNSVTEDGEDWCMTGLPFFYTKLTILRAVFPDGDYGSSIHNAIGAWEHIACGHARAGEHDKALEALETLIQLSRQHDALPRKSIHTSPMFKSHVYEKNEIYESCTEHLRKFLCEEKYTWTALEPWPEDFKADPRFRALRDELASNII